jgi:hypothetical protein
MELSETQLNTQVCYSESQQTQFSQFEPSISKWCRFLGLHPKLPSRIEFIDNDIKIGRGNDCDIHIVDPRISLVHCIVSYEVDETQGYSVFLKDTRFYLFLDLYLYEI